MSSFSQVAEALTGLIYHRPSGENFSSYSTPSSQTDHLRVTDPLSGCAKIWSDSKGAGRDIQGSKHQEIRCSDSSVSFAFRLNLTAITQMISFIPPAAHYQQCFAQTCPWQLYLWSVTTNKLNMRCVEILLGLNFSLSSKCFNISV